MLKAYIIRSRVKTNTNMLIVQPYSPHLFRQGLLPGPGLLYDVLTRKVTTKQAMAAWKELEKDRPAMTLHMWYSGYTNETNEYFKKRALSRCVEYNQMTS